MKPPSIVQLEFQNNQSYVVADHLEGGMGSVYKLYPIVDNEPTIAMKTIKGESSIKLFDDECEAWLSISYHPNVAKAFAFGSWNGIPSVLVEWYPSSLDKIKANTLSYAEIIKLIAGTVSALNFAYNKNRLIHQDIKPANILVDADMNPMLSDFGLAKCVSVDENKKFEDLIFGRKGNANAALSGTPYFMAPELWENAQPSISTDIFSLGITFFNFLTSQHPYVDLSAGKKKVSEMPRLEILTNNLPKLTKDEISTISNFLSRCLELNPNKRYQHYSEIFVDLHEHPETDLEKYWTIEKSKSIASVAQFYLGKGNSKLAISTLENVLKARPNDVLLISRLAYVYYEIGQAAEAELYNGIAYNNLKNTNGVFLGEFVPEPAFNWARNLILRKQYTEAAAVVQEILRWEKLANVNSSRSIHKTAMYSEIGWYYLFVGEFEKSCEYLIRYSQRCSLDRLSTMWLVQAAWLSKMLGLYADEIASNILKLTPSLSTDTDGALEFVWARVVLGQHTNSELSSKLWKATPSYLFLETTNLEKKYEIQAGALLMPTTTSMQKPFLLEIDKLSTAGAHREFIQSF